MIARDADARLTFDDVAWAWLVSQPPPVIMDFFAGATWLLGALHMRGHAWAEKGETPEDLRISLRLFTLLPEECGPCARP
jgi:hypothetical protein